MDFLTRLEKKISDKLQGGIERVWGQDGSRELLEIERAILDEIESRVQAVGRRKRSLPFNHLTIKIPEPDRDRRAILEMAFQDDKSLEKDIRERLMQAGSDAPPGFQVNVIITDQDVPESAGKGYAITYGRQSTSTSAPHAQLTVIRGQAVQATYALQKSRINIGRLAEVLDREQSVKRRNDVVFLDTDDPANQTVSREHAHIQLDAASGEFRLYDDHSVHGTRLFRDGRPIEISAGNSRGVKLISGDEIFLGQAGLRFETGA